VHQPSGAETGQPPAPVRPEHNELELEERPAKHAPLELEAPRPHAESDYVPPRAPRRQSAPGGGGSGRWLVLLLVLAALAGGGYYYFFGQTPKGPPPRPKIAITITVTSEPSGAAVNVEGAPVGTTPWAADNIWARGPVNVSLTLPGYRPWTGTFPGGRPARLEARLLKR
jgi:eukaryotic-like serine/threonine-protein kinase